MKVAPALAAALVLCIAIPGSNQGKGKKPKFCTGEDGNRYKRGKGYEDKEACIRYTCVYIKKGNKLKMKETKIQCTESLKSNVSSLEESVKSIEANIASMHEMMINLTAVIQANSAAIQANQDSVTKTIQSTTKLSDSVSANTAALANKCDDTTCDTIQTAATQLGSNVATNLAAIKTNKDDISTNTAALATKCDASSCSSLQTTATNIESCLADISSSDCPQPASGKTSVAEGISANTAALDGKCDASTCSDIQGAIAQLQPTNLVLTGGSSDATLGASSEVLSPEGVCKQNIPALPYGVDSAESVFIDNKLMLCGGYNRLTKTTKKKCHFLTSSTSKWIEGPEMTTERRSFSLVKVGNEVFATGGAGTEQGIDSIEKYSGGQWTLLSQKLSSPRCEHCSVYWNKLLVTIAGYHFTPGTHHFTNKVESLNLVSGEQTNLPPLPVPNLRLHTCIVHKETMFVVGGLVSGNVQNAGRKNTVWKYNEGTWEVSGQMKAAREYHSVNVLDGKLLVVGSYALGNKLTWIERMNDDETWEYMPWSIAGKRDGPAGVQVPVNKFPCLPK